MLSKQIVVGSVLGPLAGLVAVWIVTVVVGIIEHTALSTGEYITGFFLILIGGAPFAYGTMLVAGLPTYLLLRRLDALRLSALLPIAVAAGVLVAMLTSRFPVGTGASWAWAAMGTAGGAAAAVTFWWCAMRTPRSRTVAT